MLPLHTFASPTLTQGENHVSINFNMPGHVQHYRPEKSVGLAYLLLLAIGFLGVHQFYIGKVGRGLGYFLTFGWLTIALWVDLFTLASQTRTVNMERRMGMR